MEPPFVVAPAAAAAAVSRVIKSGQCQAFQTSMYNANAATRYMQIFDAAAQPADGALPIQTVQVPAGSTGSFDWGSRGRPFVNGLCVVSSQTATTLTAGSADGIFDGTTYP